jgi:hypothetical protein
MIKKKSPLKQEDPKPTYSNMPTSKRSGFKDRPYTATKKDSADYREGFNNPNKLFSSRITPYIPGRVSKEVRDAANAKKNVAREKMQKRFENNASNRGLTTEEYSKYLDKQSKKKNVPAGNPRTSFGTPSGGKGSGAKCPFMPS